MGATSTIPLNMASVTPNDNGNLSAYGTLYIETAGDIKVTTIDGNTVTVAVTNFVFFPIAVKKVFATGTTATGIFVCF